MNEQQLPKNIAKLQERVRRAAEKSQNGNSAVQIIAVSKTRSAQEIRAAHACGLTHFGESYLQEALQKVSDLDDLPLTWHFIGPIQSNKTAGIAPHFDWVHSIDRAKIAQRLNDQRPPELAPLQVCLQVNISGEDSKSGVSLEDLPQLARTVCELPHLKLRGLMGIPAAGADTLQLHQDFGQLRTALAELQTLAPDIDTLSMGMSGDMEPAIMEGATMVRVGTAIFGPRNR
ncbi:Pyridoxal phosphate homeostasis protein [Halioglobus japonicus]|nr:Pyridoxal phosphate homeostasis protein [Halioglobus japonicus]